MNSVSPEPSSECVKFLDAVTIRLGEIQPNVAELVVCNLHDIVGFDFVDH